MPEQYKSHIYVKKVAPLEYITPLQLYMLCDFINKDDKELFEFINSTRINNYGVKFNLHFFNKVQLEFILVNLGTFLSKDNPYYNLIEDVRYLYEELFHIILNYTETTEEEYNSWKDFYKSDIEFI